MLVLYSVCHTSGHYNLPWNVKILSWIMACISEITVILIGNYRALEMFLIMIECYSSFQPVCSSDVFIYMSKLGVRELSVFCTFPFPLHSSVKLRYEASLSAHIILFWSDLCHSVFIKVQSLKISRLISSFSADFQRERQSKWSLKASRGLQV